MREKDEKNERERSRKKTKEDKVIR